MSELVGFFVIAVVVITCCAIRIREQRHQQRSEATNASVHLPEFRETMTERRRQRQQEANAAATSQQEPSQPSTPAERTEEQIKKQLFFRSLEDGESIRSVDKLLAAANERYDANTDGNFLVRSYRAATSSVRTLTGRPECCICLDGYEDGDVVCWAKTDECDHLFHDECIIEWLKNNDDCPLCRANLMEEDDEEN